MRHLLLSILAALLVPQAALAKSHLWRFTEVFSNADGTVQFIEMFVFDPAGTQEWRIEGASLQSDANAFIFPHDLPNENTFQRWILIATPAFASLPGAPAPDYIIPAGFFDPAGDELRYRTAIDTMTLPPGAVPVDGFLSYLRDGSTAPNTPTNFAGEEGQIDLAQPCADGLDNDGDGYVDFPNDPACQDAAWPREDSQCQNGLDDDGAPGTDFDGGESILGPGGIDPAGADPQCVGRPWRNTELKTASCGVGGELVLGVAVLAAARRRRRVRR